MMRAILLLGLTLSAAAGDPLPAKPELTAVDTGEPLCLSRGTARKESTYMFAPSLPAGAALQLVAPRGGQASAAAVARAEKLPALRVVAPRLTGPGGAVLPDAAVQVRWLTGEAFADVFSEKPTEPQEQPLLVTVRPPLDAKPGPYTGRLEVTGAGALNIEVQVAPWTMPPREKRQTIVGFLHSPDSIALHYKVEPWSDQHLKLMEPSLRLLADLGGRDCMVFLIAEGLMYERFSMVRLRADGQPDFTCMDRYLDLWQRICGRPRSMTLYTWDFKGNSHGGGVTADKLRERIFRITGLSGQGSPANIATPRWEDPAGAAYWKAVFAGIRQRLAGRGWQETELLLGLPWDNLPDEETVASLSTLSNGLRWRVFSHGFGYPKPDTQGRLIMPCGAEVGWYEAIAPIGVGHMKSKFPSIIAAGGMKRIYPMTTICRDQATLTAPMWVWRDAAPSTIRAGMQGFSQIGMDFWPVTLPDGRSRGDLIRNGIGGFEPRHNGAKYITAPGPQGAEPRLQYEMVREGLQACEAWWAVRAAGNAAADAAFEAFMKQRLDHLNPIRRGKNEAPIEVSEVASQSKWNAAVSALFQSAGKVNP